MMKKAQMKCGCWRMPDNDSDAANFPAMSCKKCVQKRVPWFMQGDPDMAKSKFWAKGSNGKWEFNEPDRGPGKWVWKMPDFEAGESSPQPVWVGE